MSGKMEELKKVIASPQIKAVSFDLFDTLIMRPCLDAPDIFTLIESGRGIAFFKQRRQAAETRARLFRDFHKADICLDDIYRSYQVMFGLTDWETNQIKEAELELELNLVHERKSVKKIYEYAKLKAKKIIVVADMYLTADILRKMLVKCGYDENIEIYASCECNAVKRDGTLYEHVILSLSHEGIYANNILHIGKDPALSIKSAENKGIKSVYIPKTKRRFLECSKLKAMRACGELSNNHHPLLLGLLANLYFDDPFIEFDNDSRYNGDAFLLGMYAAPFFISFCLWLAKETRRDNTGLLLMVWRGGWLVDKILDMLEPSLPFRLPKRERVFLNKELRYPFYSLYKGGLFDSVQQRALDAKTSVMQFVQRYLRLAEDEDVTAALSVFVKHGYTSRYQELGPPQNYIWFIHEFEPLFRKGCKEHIKLAGESLLSYKNDKSIGVYDIGCGDCVSGFLKDNYDIDSNAYHLLGESGLRRDYQGGTVKAFAEQGMPATRDTNDKLRRLMELILCEQSPDAVGFRKSPSGEKELVFDPNFEPDDTINSIQKGILQYTACFSDVFEKYMDVLSLDNQMFRSMITKILSKPNKKDAGLLKNLTCGTDYFSGNTESFEQWYDKFFPDKK